MTPGSTSLPGRETRRGQEHARKAGDEPKAFRALPRKTRVIWRELDCPNPKFQRCNGTPAATTPVHGAIDNRRAVASRQRPSDRWAMKNDFIQGTEWGAYVTLVRSATRNAGSPTGREPYGDGVPIVAVQDANPDPTKGDRWSDEQSARYS
jgi:hypothetical protein